MAGRLSPLSNGTVASENYLRGSSRNTDGDRGLYSRHISMTVTNTSSRSTSTTLTRPSVLRSRRSDSRSVSSVNSRISSGYDQTAKNPLDDMTNSELVQVVEELQKNVKHFQLENTIFLHFLEQNDPSSVEAMAASLKYAEVRQERASISSKRLTLNRLSRRSSAFIGSTISVGTPPALDKEGPRINISQKTDLVVREMDAIKAALEALSKRCHAVRHKLTAQLEEMSIREFEIEGTMQTFEDIFVNDTVEKYKQKDPGVKFARFMEDCFKQNRTLIDKLRLRTSSLKVQYQKICCLLSQKKVLGENLQEVDFEQLQISNKRLITKIDQRNLLLLELKKINGRANFLLSRSKKILLKKEEHLKDIKDSIAFQESSLVKMDDECEKVASELEAAKDEYYKIKEKSENYEVPTILDYVKTKAELGVLKKNLKIWSRRKQLKDMALAASLREMKVVSTLKSTDAEPAFLLSPRSKPRRSSTTGLEM